jgi:hypothetical protein
MSSKIDGSSGLQDGVKNFRYLEFSAINTASADPIEASGSLFLPLRLAE